MKQLHNDQRDNLAVYLIERGTDIHDIIDNHKKDIGISHVCTYQVIRDNVYIEGGTLPNVYPYVLVLDIDDERCGITVAQVTLDHFKNSGKLFEFRLKKTMLTSPYSSRELDYQVDASDIFEAHLKLGRTFHHDEEYEIEVLSFNAVKF